MRTPPVITNQDSHEVFGRMIPSNEFSARRAAAVSAAAAGGLNGLLVVGRSFYDRPGDIAYLTNHFPPFPTAVFSEGNSGFGHAFLLLPVEGDPVLLTDLRRHRADLVEIEDVRSAADLGAAVIELLSERSLDTARLGLVGDDILPAALDREFAMALPKLRLEAEREVVANLRRRKSEPELALLRAAARCADAGLESAYDRFTSAGVTERDVAAAGTARAIATGADFVRYFRVHSGHWSAAGSRWPPAMSRPIATDEVAVVDIIGAHQGYHFDVNRTFGRPELNQQSREVAEVVLEATEAAVEACLPGTTVDAVFTAAKAVFDRSPCHEFASGMFGHGIGLETVELPYIRAGDQSMLEPGMVLCIEPGVFIPGTTGAAIEQEVIIRETGGPEVITSAPARMW